MKEQNNKKENKLDQLGKTFPYDIPEGYFEKFPSRMEKKIFQKKEVKLKSHNTRAIYKLMPAAAVIVILIVSSVVFLRYSEQDISSTETNDLAFDQFEYINDADIYESELFMELLGDEAYSDETEEYIENLLAEDEFMEYFVYEDNENLQLIKNF